MMQHLLSHQHRKIALISGPISVSANRHRHETWKRSLRNAGIDAPDEYFLSGPLTSDSGYLCAQKLLMLGASRPTAIFAANFLIMTGVLKAMRQAGLQCPADIELTCADDSEWLDVFDPPISTVIQPSYEMGKQSAELLLKRMNQPKGTRELILLKPKLRIRVQDFRRQCPVGDQTA